jgi:acyl-CoA synthetase (AMP-forming)/AMP-acid ligase II
MSELSQEFAAAIAQLTAAGAPFELGGDEATGRYYVNAPATLPAALGAARQHGEREFLLYEGERRSFSELMAEADLIANALQARGIRKGDRVAIAMRNYPEWMVAFIGITQMGAVIVPVNSWGQPADIAYTLEDAGARLVFCDQQRYDGVAQWLQDNDVDAVIARPAQRDDPRGWDAFLEGARGVAPAPVALTSDDLAMIMYTSGTSGKAKGAASTHRALCQAIFNMECCAFAAAMTNGEAVTVMLQRGFEPTSLLALPLFHVSGCHAQFLVNLRAGRRMVMMFKWDVDRALEYIERERITGISAAPAMVLDLLESPRYAQTDTSSLFTLGVGGAATPKKVTQLLGEKLPQNFSGTGWGMTETNAQGASLTGKAWSVKPGSSGFVHPIVDIRICDEQGAILPQRSTGEIWVRSVASIREYWKRPEINAQEFRDGWLKTGDIGYLDDGFLFLADRAKDMIIRGGENIYPFDIENELIEHPAVKEVAAIGLPHERMGEEVCVVVHPSSPVTETQLLAFAKERLASYKVPARVVFTEQPLPRNATNKILKREIRQRLLEELGLESSS